MVKVGIIYKRKATPMSATSTTFPIPANALTIWRDRTNIFVLLPGPTEAGTIISYPFATGGLSKALALLGKQPDTSGTPEYAPARRLQRVGTPAQHSAAHMILQKQGLIP